MRACVSSHGITGARIHQDSIMRCDYHFTTISFFEYTFFFFHISLGCNQHSSIPRICHSSSSRAGCRPPAPHRYLSSIISVTSPSSIEPRLSPGCPSVRCAFRDQGITRRRTAVKELDVQVRLRVFPWRQTQPKALRLDENDLP